MKIHAILAHSTANGPGERAVIWMQGCKLACRGCWNTGLWPMDEGLDLHPDQVAERIVKAAGRRPIEGVTFSGGEPLHQAGALASLIVEIRHRLTGLSFGLFSGYSQEELDAGNYSSTTEPRVEQRIAVWQSIRHALDFAVLGRYDCTQPSDDPLVTSRNQRLVLFDSRYTEADFAPRVTEVTIMPGGTGFITGFPVLGSPAA